MWRTNDDSLIRYSKNTPNDVERQLQQPRRMDGCLRSAAKVETEKAGVVSEALTG